MDVLLLSRLQFTATTIFHFFFVPLTLGLVGAGRDHGDSVRAHRQRNLPQDDPVLGQAVPDQLRRGGRHRHHAGVPVRYQLVGVFGLRGRHLRLAFGHRSHCGLFPGVHADRRLGVRLEEALAQSACGGDVARGRGEQPFRHLDPHRQRLDAAAGGVCHPQRPGRADRFCRRGLQHLQHPADPARGTGGLASGGLFHHGHQRLSPAQATEHGLFHPLLPTRPGGGHDRLLLGHPRRRHARQACDQGPAGQARRHGVALGHHVPGAGLHVCRAG